MSKKQTTPIQYNDDAIQILEGLDAVRKRPGMYIGSTDQRGLHHLIYEIVDNSVDEALSGFADYISVTIETDGSVRVQDNGRGMPVGQHATGVPTIQVIFTVLHAGGKFGQGGYKSSGGLHGVGASVVNALSSWLTVDVEREGSHYDMRFEDGGKPVTKLKKSKAATKTGHGTTVHFMPDKTIFGNAQINSEVIADRLRESAFLLKGLTIEITDKRQDYHEVFHYERGLEDFIQYLNEEKDLLGDTFSFSATSEEFEIDFAMQYNDGYSETILSFANNVRTASGGTHEVGMKTGITKAFNEYGRRVGLIKEKDKNLEGSDVREGLTAVISLRIPEQYLQFEGQTKEKLGTPKARALVENLVVERLASFLNENGNFSQMILRKAIRARETRELARKARDAARSGSKKSAQEKLISGKLTKAQSKDASKNELYLVEGDSAGGSAKLGRDRQYQAILPLRGKVINTEKASMQDIMKNEEINTMIYTIGAGVGADFDIESVNYDKVIIMTDADTDGAHIQVLLLTFFYRYMKPLLEAGKVYLAMPPLFKVSRGSGKKQVIEYAWTDEELDAAIKKVGKGYMLQRYKGLGEMNADQLWETTMNPETRILIRVTIDDAAQVERRVTTLMGNKVEPRRKWIEKNVQFTLETEDTLLNEHHGSANEEHEKIVSQQIQVNEEDTMEQMELF
ncbi:MULTISPECIES: DNA topoisomerase IV subunit B [unclassified Facklamia]|uniref:DNA topoisomerase IV subunit B n=1 Tax=Aerococcaceae TaxID=186827 RepID=UPI0013B65C54|nr:MULTISPECIES: DNA topoisomerase IV subunit B [unclassified Facklamia]MBS4461101.1 DNA topoisomerase IV subunit B [Aerococcaceae bacterium zg-B36]NEW64410.1 DNA topoisomerase IV subunit B [Facklamia sp. 252]NEW68491.1 DNA topoisomerase IV subunit B [Facklamia sp. 253]QQD64870.1 DNA topoisomerase IV subunit B [Aerococcaceae bacterium zg-252]